MGQLLTIYLFINSQIQELVNPELLPSYINLGELTPRDNSSNAWLVAIFLLQLVIFTWVKLVYPNRLGQLLSAFISNRFVNQLAREEKSFSGIYSLLLEGLYFISISMFLLVANKYFQLVNIRTIPMLSFLLIIGIAIAVSLIKSFLIRTFMWLFSMENYSNDLIFYRFLNHAVLALFLFPFLILSQFSELPKVFLIAPMLVIVVLSLIYRLTRSGIRFWQGNSFSLKYIILYICTLEILPLSIAIKYAYNNL